MVATALTFGLLFLRFATSPTGAGFLTALAPAPGAGLYLADDARARLVEIGPNGSRTVGAIPAGAYRSLAADALGGLLLGTDGGLYVSEDAGATWRRTIEGGRFTAVAIGPTSWLAAAWNQGLYLSIDRGATWTMASVPAGDLQFEGVVPGFAATLLGLLHSADGGRTWARLPGSGDRMTAVSLTGDAADPVRAGDWYGRLWRYRAGRLTVAGSSCSGGGIWSLAGQVVAGTEGLCPKPGSGAPDLAGREVTRVVDSGGTYYAAVARGAIFTSGDGVGWRLAYQP